MPGETSLDLRNRPEGFAALASQPFDLLVIGAGITGGGVARDAAMRGLRVALVEANDIGSGTSSRSSKLIHGGLRYLAQRDVLIVREAANERRILRVIAPHLALTLPMVVLARSKSVLTQLRAALWAYEKLGHVDKHEKHEVWDQSRLKTEEPHVLVDGLAGAIVYPEYLTDDFRLTLANIRSAVAHGATVLTYAAVEEIIQENGQATGAVVGSTLPGSQEKAIIKARLIVNAAGPWLDAVRRLEDPSAVEKLQLTKGIHLVFAREGIPIKRAIVKMTPDHRSIFLVPRGPFIYLGTTDTFHPQPDYWPEITQADVDYLFENTADIFDFGPLNITQIIAAWSGLRPLLGQAGKKPSEISRRHEILTGPAGVLTVAGGKLTSYRSMAERVIDECEKKLGRRSIPSGTADELLPGGDFSGTFEELCSRIEALDVSSEEARRLAQLYGGEALSIFAQETGPAIEAEHAVKNEGALTLEDYWVRRSARARFDQDGGLAALIPASERMAQLLGWSAEERERQVSECRRQQQAEMGLWAK